MNKIAIAVGVALFAIAQLASAQQYVPGYMRSDGTYVQGYTRSAPNANRFDNYGSQSMGGSQRDEFSRAPAYNRSSPSYGYGDNDRDGLSNSFDPKPNSRCNYAFGC